MIVTPPRAVIVKFWGPGGLAPTAYWCVVCSRACRFDLFAVHAKHIDFSHPENAPLNHSISLKTDGLGRDGLSEDVGHVDARPLVVLVHGVEHSYKFGGRRGGVRGRLAGGGCGV